MELSEAKEILEHESKYNESLNKTTEELLTNENLHWSAPYASNFEIDLHRRTRVNEAIDTVLKALDNSISKKQHDIIVKSMNSIIDSLQEKLDNSISKDEYDIYPLTIIKDRYCGTYSGSEYTAWNLDFEDIPQEINYDDVSCQIFWRDNKILVGKGENPIEAINNLKELLGE